MSRTIRPLLLSSLVLGTVLVGCSSAPKPIDSLEQVRMDYKSASENPTVVKHAADELDEAEAALNKADRLWRDKAKRKDIDNQTYIAKRKLEIARLVSKTNEADRQAVDMELERRNVTLDIRESQLQKSRQAAEQARAEAEELKRQMAELQARETDRGMVLTLGDVLFDTGKAELAPGATRNIEKIAAFMQKYPERQALIEGHTDDVGDETYNNLLSQDRALAVKEALTRRGVSSGRIATQGFGEFQPIASNADAAGRQKNRRVEIIFPDETTAVGELGE